MLFIFNKKAKNNFDLLKDSYVSTDKVESQMVLKNSIFPSDQVNFQNAIGVCSVIRGKSFEYIDKIHTKKDTVLREENIEFLVDKSIDLVNKI
jgi:hypothetical protein